MCVTQHGKYNSCWAFLSKMGSQQVIHCPFLTLCAVSLSWSRGALHTQTALQCRVGSGVPEGYRRGRGLTWIKMTQSWRNLLAGQFFTPTRCSHVANVNPPPHWEETCLRLNACWPTMSNGHSYGYIFEQFEFLWKDCWFEFWVPHMVGQIFMHEFTTKWICLPVSNKNLQGIKEPSSECADVVGEGINMSTWPCRFVNKIDPVLVAFVHSLSWTQLFPGHHLLTRPKNHAGLATILCLICTKFFTAFSEIGSGSGSGSTKERKRTLDLHPQFLLANSVVFFLLQAIYCVVTTQNYSKYYVDFYHLLCEDTTPTAKASGEI